ncbi:MAG: hypothetical protein AB7K04_15085, partial [Pseudorhodoplanes sp.]
MITLDQAGTAAAPRTHAARAASPRASRRVPAIAITLLHGVLFLTIFGSFLVFIEPSPYEVLTALLAFTCLLAGVTL